MPRVSLLLNQLLASKFTTDDVTCARNVPVLNFKAVLFAFLEPKSECQENQFYLCACMNSVNMTVLMKLEEAVHAEGRQHQIKREYYLPA
jgi:hypothetical protein